MPRLRVCCFGLSLDGFGAGPDQDGNNPLGVGGTALHEWFVPTRTFQAMFGHDRGDTGPDDDFAARGIECKAYVGTDKAAHYVLARTR